jgi:hypothetical protein
MNFERLDYGYSYDEGLLKKYVNKYDKILEE